MHIIVWSSRENLKTREEKEKVTEGWVVLCKEELNDLYCLTNCTGW
jgi:hypothetical protein